MFKVSSKLLVFLVLIVSLGFTGNSFAAESHLTKILKAGEITVGVQSQAPPWGVLQADGSYAGFDIDIAKALGEALGVDIEFVPVTNASRIPVLKADKVDVVIASFTATNQRAKQVEFTIPYVVTGTLVMVQEDSEIKNYQDLAGKSVSTTRGSVGQTALHENFPDAKEVLFRSVADSIQALRSKKTDALIENSVLVAELVSRAPEKFRVLDGAIINPSFFGMGVKPEDQRWLNYLNNFIRNYNVSGKNQIAHQKWLHTDMSDFLK